VKKERRE